MLEADLIVKVEFLIVKVEFHASSFYSSRQGLYLKVKG